MGKTSLQSFAILCSFLFSFGFGAQTQAAPAGLFHIVLDAGHGGDDEGAQKEGLSEKTLALQLAQAIAKKLSENLLYSAVLTRKGDYSLSFDERRRIANTNTPGIFVSLHFAAAPDQNVHGSRIFVLGGSAITESKFLIPIEQAHIPMVSQSLKLATCLSEEIKKISPELKTQISGLPLSSLVGMTIPAVLIEADFLTQPEASQWKEEKHSTSLQKRWLKVLIDFIPKGTVKTHEKRLAR